MSTESTYMRGHMRRHTISTPGSGPGSAPAARRPLRVSTRRPMALEPGFSRRSRGRSVVPGR